MKIWTDKPPVYTWTIFPEKYLVALPHNEFSRYDCVQIRTLRDFIGVIHDVLAFIRTNIFMDSFRGYFFHLKSLQLGAWPKLKSGGPQLSEDLLLPLPALPCGHATDYSVLYTLKFAQILTISSSYWHSYCYCLRYYA